MRKFIVPFLSLLLFACSATPPKKLSINGISFVASKEAVNQSHITPVVNVNANYAAVMPFAFIRDLTSPEVAYNSNRQWYGETKQGSKQYIEELKNNNIKIMLKPQLWVWRGEFTGNIEMNSEEDWKTFEKSYAKFILDYAQVAEDNHVEIYCIGTELNKFISLRPLYWKQLIEDVKTIYKGKLTYAENWDTFVNVPFWNELDFIGIDAYFPLSDEQNPTREALISGWRVHKEKIESLSKQLKKQIIFTEYGYRSVDFNAKEPWDSNRKNNAVNLNAQSTALDVLYDQFWEEDWFAGGFLWKWYHDHEKAGGEKNSRFTPQNKPAEEIVRTQYSLN